MIEFRNRVLAATLMLVFCGNAVLVCTASDRQSGGSIREALKVAEARGGLVVQLGCDDGRLPSRFGALSGTLTQVLERDRDEIAEVRRRIHKARLADTTSVSQWDGRHLPYVDDVVNLVVAVKSVEVSKDEILRVLAPGGIAFLQRDGAWTKIIKPRSLRTDEWTHFMHGPDNNPVAADTEVDYPNGLQWIESPLWTRDHDSAPSVFGLVSAAGRLFYILDEGPIGIIDERLPGRHSLIARDAHNGVQLWKRVLPDWYPSHVQWGTTPIYLHRRLVAVDDRVYVTDGLHGPVVALDAADGKKLHTYAGSEDAAEILLDRGMLVVGIMKTEAQPGDENPSNRDQPFKNARLRNHRGRGSALIVFDAQSGKQLWRQACEFVPSSICSDGSRLFYSTSERLACVDLRNGKERWTSPGGVSKIMLHDGIVVAATEAQGKRWNPRIALEARSTADGALLWKTDAETLPTFANCFYIPPEFFIAGDLVWIRPLKGNEIIGLDLHTGERGRSVSLEGAFTPGHHVRCYPAKATERFALFNKRGIEFMDLSGEAGFRKHDWIRGGCRLGILPCNGMIYVPPNGCNCCVETYVRGFLALRSTHEPRPIADATRLTHGPAYDEVPNPQTSTPNSRVDDWPTFRHDAARSSASASSVDAPFKERWREEFSGRLTSPTVAGNRLFFSEIETRTVHALDAQTGDSLWSFIADGPVDSPPTLSDGLAVFGASDGCVYCLRAADGLLVWRFRAAPADRRLVAFGRVESVWPCHGSVLVEGGIVYVTAGRSSYLNGGIHLYGLDLKSGRIIHRNDVRTEQQQRTTLKDTYNNAGALTDVLVSNGEHIFMRQVKFDERLQHVSPLYPFDEGHRAAGSRVMATSGFLDHSGNKRVYRACSETWTGRYSALRTQQLAASERSVYGCRIHFGRGWKSPRYHPVDGTLVFAMDHAAAADLPREATVGAAIGGNGRRWHFTIPRESFRWQQQVSVYARAVVLAADKLLVAGRPDRSVDDAKTAVDNHRSGALFVFSAKNGDLLHDQVLSAPPVVDGVIVAGGRIFASTDDNHIVCLEGATE